MCDCFNYPNMHDGRGVCVNWDKHNKNPESKILPCPWWHYQTAAGTRKVNRG